MLTGNQSSKLLKRPVHCIDHELKLCLFVLANEPDPAKPLNRQCRCQISTGLTVSLPAMALQDIDRSSPLGSKRRHYLRRYRLLLMLCDDISVSRTRNPLCTVHDICLQPSLMPCIQMIVISCEWIQIPLSVR